MQDFLVEAEVLVGVENADELPGGFLAGVDLEEVEPLDVLDYLVLEEGAAHSPEAQIRLVDYGFLESSLFDVSWEPGWQVDHLIVRHMLLGLGVEDPQPQSERKRKHFSSHPANNLFVASAIFEVISM